jgi:hypothetical protein
MVQMEKSSIQKGIVLILIFLIILLATVFHFQVHFENALTLQKELDYDVKISMWRILFEPIIGPLLYLNRSLYVLKELPLILLWVLIFNTAYSLFVIFKTPRNATNTILGKLANLPLILGVFFAIFVLVLFIPLPNNSIVNNSKDSILVTTHAHTEFSHDGLTSQENLWKWHKRNGFDAFFITDHANHQKSLQFARDQKKGKFPSTPLVMVGQEHSGTNHMSLLGLNGKFDTKGMTDKAVIDSVHKYGGAVIINHWFDGKGKAKERYEALGADGFEIENTGKDLYYDRETFEQLKTFCVKNRLTMIGGLDFHGYGRVCTLYNALKIPNWDSLNDVSKQQSILDIFKNGPQENIKVLLYKDRPFYPKTYLFIRPFSTVVNYFRTLNLWQVVSWVFWILVFQFTGRPIKRDLVRPKTGLVMVALGGAIFMLVLAFIYHFRGEAVKGYSTVYSEYSMLLGPIGLILLLYALALAYFRFFRPKRP